MSDQIARLLYKGAVAVRAGRREEAQDLLMQVIEHDERNEEAWLWLSGAVQDPSDQQVALENVLAINPANEAARQGLEWLNKSYGGATIKESPQGGEWTPPPPLAEDDVVELSCWKCSASLYSVAQFCWQCHAPVHTCKNCVFTLETRCKELQGLSGAVTQAGQNECP